MLVHRLRFSAFIFIAFPGSVPNLPLAQEKWEKCKLLIHSKLVP